MYQNHVCEHFQLIHFDDNYHEDQNVINLKYHYMIQNLINTDLHQKMLALLHHKKKETFKKD